MARKDVFRRTGVLLALCGAAACFLMAGAQYPEMQPPGISGPSDLRSELEWAQFVAPPSVEPLSYDAGFFIFLPDSSDPDSGRFAEGLFPEGDDGKCQVRPVTVYEDYRTCDTVFLNVEGAEILRLPPPTGYDPDWILRSLYPDGDVPNGVAAAYDPSRVVMTADLVVPRLAGRTGAGVSGAIKGGDGRGKNELTEGQTPLAAEAVTTFAAGGPPGSMPEASSAQNAAVPGGGSSTNAPSRHASAKGTYSERVVYVDARLGKDSWSGRSADPVKGPDQIMSVNGPKRSVCSGLEALRKSETLVILKGAYAENLDVRGAKADVRMRGRVVLGKCVKNPEVGPVPPEGCVSASTGTVTRVAFD